MTTQNNKITDEQLVAAATFEIGDQVNITFTKGTEGPHSVGLSVNVVGTNEDSKVPYTAPIIFAETLKRLFERPNSLWPLAQALVPEAFTQPEAPEVVEEKEAPKKAAKKATVKKKATPKKK